MAVATLALAAVWREAAMARAASLAEADRRAAVQVAHYLSIVAPPGGGARSGGDARLLSAAGALLGASFWQGGAQVWLDHTPILSGDTAGTHAAVAPLLHLDGSPRGAVAAWGSVPSAGDAAMVTVSGSLALAAMLAAGLVGSAAQRRRTRVILVGLTLAVVASGIAGQVGAVQAAQRAATDAGLLRTRRVLEVGGVNGRLPSAAVDDLAPGLVVSPLRAADVVRDSLVARDTSGAWVIAVAGQGRAWRLVDRGSAEAVAGVQARILGLGLFALLVTFAAAALPPGAGYFTKSRPDPRAPA